MPFIFRAVRAIAWLHFHAKHRFFARECCPKKTGTPACTAIPDFVTHAAPGSPFLAPKTPR